MTMHDSWNDISGTFQVTKDTAVFFQQESGKLSSFSQLSLRKDQLTNHRSDSRGVNSSMVNPSTQLISALHRKHRVFEFHYGCQLIFVISKLKSAWRGLFPSDLVWVEDWHSAPDEYTPVLVACFRQQDNVAWWLHHCVDCWPHECTFQSNSLLHREWGDHPKRHLVPYMLGNQPMFRGHGQSDTDLFHSAVRREFQIAFEQGRA